MCFFKYKYLFKPICIRPQDVNFLGPVFEEKNLLMDQYIIEYFIDLLPH